MLNKIQNYKKKFSVEISVLVLVQFELQKLEQVQLPTI